MNIPETTTRKPSSLGKGLQAPQPSSACELGPPCSSVQPHSEAYALAATAPMCRKMTRDQRPPDRHRSASAKRSQSASQAIARASTTTHRKRETEPHPPAARPSHSYHSFGNHIRTMLKRQGQHPPTGPQWGRAAWRARSCPHPASIPAPRLQRRVCERPHRYSSSRNSVMRSGVSQWRCALRARCEAAKDVRAPNRTDRRSRSGKRSSHCSD